MLIDYQLTQTSIILRVKVRQDTTGAKPGNGFTGLTNSSTGLVIGTIADNESSSTAYTSAGGTIDTIATLGTFSTPTANHCNLKLVDNTNHPGLIELQLANARYAVSSAKSLNVTISGVSGMSDCDVCIPLRSVNPYDSVRFGQTALPNAAAGANTGLPVVGTQVPNATAGATNGLLIAGSNAATTFATLTSTGAFTTGGFSAGAISCTTLTASGAVAFQSTFAVTTSTALGAISGSTLTLSGAVAFQSTFTVSGATSLTGLSTGAFSCTTLTATGAVAFQSTFAVTTSTALAALSCTTLTASGAVAFQSTFAVTTSTSLAALSCTTLTASGAVAFQSTFATTGTTTFNAFTVTNALTVSGTTTLTGAVSLGSTLGVTGTTTFAAIGTGNVTITGTLSTSGTATFNALAVTTTTTLSGNVSLGGTLGVTGATTFAAVNTGTITTTGNVSVSGTTTLTGAVTAANASNNIVGVALAASQHVIVDSGTVTTVTNQLTTAQIATGVWTDTTAGDFTAALSIGKSILNGVSLGTGLTVNSLTTNADKTGYSLAANQHVIVDSGTVTTVTNQLTAAQIATGIFQDTTAGDFTVAGSIGKSLFTSGNAPGAASGLALVGSNVGTATSVSGAVGSVTAGVTLAANQHVIVDSGTITNVTGDVQGKVLGGGASVITAAGVWALDGAGNPLAAASTALSNATWTGALATSLTTLASHDPGSTLFAALSYTVPLSAAGTRTALGMAAANLDTQLATIDVDVLTRAPLSTALSTVTWTGSLATNLGTLAGHDPGTTLASRTNITTATGIQLDTTQVVTLADVTLHTTCTVADALLSARAQAAGAWSISGTSLVLKNPDGSVFRTFALDSSTPPITSRT